MTNLRERRIEIDQSAGRNRQHPGTNRVDAADIQQEIRALADADGAVSARAGPLRGMCVPVRPPLSKSTPIENARGEAESVRRVDSGVGRRRIVAARVIIAVLEKVDVMAEATKAFEVLQ